MKYKGTMLIVKDIEKAKAFYTKVLGVRVIADFGENATFTGDVSVQTEQSWMKFIDCDQDYFRYQGNVTELYFEDEDFEGFMQKIEAMGIECISQTTMAWGQKVVRFYDPDKHIIEVGEDLAVMVKRLHNSGMSLDDLVKKTFMKKGILERILKSK